MRTISILDSQAHRLASRLGHPSQLVPQNAQDGMQMGSSSPGAGEIMEPSFHSVIKKGFFFFKMAYYIYTYHT